MGIKRGLFQEKKATSEVFYIVVVEAATQVVDIDTLGNGGLGFPPCRRVGGAVDEDAVTVEYLQLVEVAFQALKARAEGAVVGVTGNNDIGKSRGRFWRVRDDDTARLAGALVEAAGIGNGKAVTIKGVVRVDIGVGEQRWLKCRCQCVPCATVDAAPQDIGGTMVGGVEPEREERVVGQAVVSQRRDIEKKSRVGGVAFHLDDVGLRYQAVDDADGLDLEPHASDTLGKFEIVAEGPRAVGAETGYIYAIERLEARPKCVSCHSRRHTLIGGPLGLDDRSAVGHAGPEDDIAEQRSERTDIVSGVKDMETIGVGLGRQMVKTVIGSVEPPKEGIVGEAGVASTDMVAQGRTVGIGSPQEMDGLGRVVDSG